MGIRKGLSNDLIVEFRKKHFALDAFTLDHFLKLRWGKFIGSYKEQ
jgi:hypothetical protein